MKSLSPFKPASLAGMFVFTALMGAATASQAQITFGTPTTISADTDVFNGGSLLYAYGFGSGAAVGSSLATVNGVNFLNAGRPSGTGTLSYANVSLTGFANNGYFGTGAPTGVSTAYAAVLSNTDYIGGGGNNGVLTLSGLTAGTNYSVELWANDSTGGNNNQHRQQTMTDGGTNTVTLFSNSGDGTTGSAGQYVIGNFTAAGTTQVIDFTQSTGAAYLNMVVVEATVPEPATWAMMVGGMGLLAGAQRLRRRVR